MSRFQFPAIQKILSHNAAQLEDLVWNAKAFCSECGIPLEENKAHNRLTEHGDVCELCFVMYMVVKNRIFFVAAHVAWQEEQTRRRKIIENKRKGEL